VILRETPRSTQKQAAADRSKALPRGKKRFLAHNRGFTTKNAKGTKDSVGQSDGQTVGQPDGRTVGRSDSQAVVACCLDASCCASWVCGLRSQ